MGAAEGTQRSERGPASSVVLGLSAGFHDSAAAIVIDGRIVAAVEEERLSRVKHDRSFPSRAADVCLAVAGIDAGDIDVVAFHEKPLDVLGRHLASRLRSGFRGVPQLMASTPGVVADQLTVGPRIARWFAHHDTPVPRLLLAEHHVSHAAAAFYPSPFDDAAVVTIDGVGESATSTLGWGRGRRIGIDRELRYPDSVGLLYSAFTAYCGFRVNGGEGELMGLAPFGTPRFATEILEHLVDVHPDGSIRLDQRAFVHVRGRRTTSSRFHDRFGGPPRPLGSAPGRREADLAASIQVVLEEIVLRMARTAHELTGSSRLCLGGGVALNCVANGRVLREGPFEEVWVQPACGDAGNALGAALWASHEVLGHGREGSGHDRMLGAFLGPRFSNDEIEGWLRTEGVDHVVMPSDDDLFDHVAGRLEAGAVVGWFRGRMEFGPRALGHRSILADPRSPTVQRRLNGLVKERAGFRPFAPAVLAERVDDWFEPAGASPFMTSVVRVVGADTADDEEGDDLETVVAQVRSRIPAVTHVDASARVQTVDAERNPDFARLIGSFDRLTGCPILLNTSFNARDEPIVCSPEDALATFRRTGLDLLVLENCVIEA